MSNEFFVAGEDEGGRVFVSMHSLNSSWNSTGEKSTHTHTRAHVYRGMQIRKYQTLLCQQS